MGVSSTAVWMCVRPAAYASDKDPGGSRGEFIAADTWRASVLYSVLGAVTFNRGLTYGLCKAIKGRPGGGSGARWLVN